MRLGIRFFFDPYAYYRHSPDQRAMLLALYEIETGSPVYRRKGKARAAPGGRPKGANNLRKGKGLKATTQAAIERMKGGR